MWRAASLTLLASSLSLLAFACSDDSGTLNGKQTGTSSGATSTSGDATSSSSGDTTSGGTSGTSGASGTAGGSPAEICVATINEYRKTKGLAPYARWTDAEACTDGESQSDATTLKGHGAFGKCGEFAQNECPGWPGPAGTMIPKCLKSMWAEGPGGGHYEAMASTKYTKVACGFGTAKDGSIWSAQNFR